MKNLYLLFPILLFLSLASCYSIRGIEDDKTHSISRIEMNGRFNFKYSGNTNENDIREVRESFLYHHSKWVEDFGRDPRYDIDVYIFWIDDLEEELGREDTERYLIGYTTQRTYGPKDTKIYLIAGRNNETPAAYHELCHAYGASLNFGFDSDHLDKNWMTWEQRQQEINRELGNR